jgi:hypothetical protein
MNNKCRVLLAFGIIIIIIIIERKSFDRVHAGSTQANFTDWCVQIYMVKGTKKMLVIAAQDSFRNSSLAGSSARGWRKGRVFEYYIISYLTRVLLYVGYVFHWIFMIIFLMHIMIIYNHY